jgi:hypothetical protein
MMFWLQLNIFLLTLLAIEGVTCWRERRARKRWLVHCLSMPSLTWVVWHEETLRLAREPMLLQRFLKESK